jgi:riboflavin kinase/FMN adenylyltransferase
MRLFRDLDTLLDDARGAAVAIGNFDGLHRGHRAVIGAMQEAAQGRNLPQAVLTFAPHPRRFFAPDAPPLALEPFHVRARRLRALGVDMLYLARFNQALSQLSARAFIEEVLVKRLGVRHVTTGENFVFGHQRSGDANFLAEAARTHGFGYTAVAPQTAEGQACSSSRVRHFLGLGDMAEATAMLGRPYEMTGRVRHGEKRGAALGYPTANLIPHALMLPAFGVYAVRYAMAEPLLPETAPVWRPGVAYLGTRPTYGGDAPWLEVHALDTPEPLYGHRLRVQLLAHLRPDARFADDAALQVQIAKDITQAKRILEATHA